jgi:hypothetical protein
MLQRPETCCTQVRGLEELHGVSSVLAVTALAKVMAVRDQRERGRICMRDSSRLV